MKKGDIAYIRDNNRKVGIYAEIKSIGRKWITAEIDGFLYHFNAETKYCKEWFIYKIYENEQAYKDECEKEDLLHNVSKCFDLWGNGGKYKLTLDQLRRIWAIINE